MESEKIAPNRNERQHSSILGTCTCECVCVFLFKMPEKEEWNHKSKANPSIWPFFQQWRSFNKVSFCKYTHIHSDCFSPGDFLTKNKCHISTGSINCENFYQLKLLHKIEVYLILIWALKSNAVMNRIFGFSSFILLFLTNCGDVQEQLKVICSIFLKLEDMFVTKLLCRCEWASTSAHAFASTSNTIHIISRTWKCN